MDGPEPDFSYAAVSAQTTKFGRVSPLQVSSLELQVTADTAKIYNSYLDKSTPFTLYRWLSTGALFIIFGVRIVVAEGWYIGAFQLCLF